MLPDLVLFKLIHMHTKISGNWKRIAVIISSILLLGSLLFPIWKIDLTAPQYPEGLSLKIWATKLSGNIATVNGLNHYIGMKTLHEEEFVEFKILPWLIIFFSLAGILVGALNKRKLLFAWMGLFIIFAGVSMGDFYYWEYNYGHNLDPTAPIQVPGMAYQPPFLGYKQMLNFSAFSIPDTGGWFFIGSGVLLFAITFFEWRSGRLKTSNHPATAIAVVAMLFIFVSCSNEIKPINYGKDDCAFCKMTIVDKRFGVEIISHKGKVFKMDDLGCAAQFVNNGRISRDDIGDVFINNFAGSGELLNIKQSSIVKNETLGSPMGGNMAAFANAHEADNFIQSNGGNLVSVQSVIAIK